MRRELRSPILATVMAAALPLSGCASLNRLTGPLGQAATTLFTSAALDDLQMVGIKTGPFIPVKASTFASSATLGQEDLQELNDALGQAPLGILLPITKVGETTPWWIFCPIGELQKRCEEIPRNAKVTFTGQPLGHSGVFLPTHLTWSAQ